MLSHCINSSRSSQWVDRRVKMSAWSWLGTSLLSFVYIWGYSVWLKMDRDPQRVHTSPQDCPVCLCYALISTGHLLLPSSCRQGNWLDWSLVTAILLLSPSYEMRAGRIHTKICKLRFLNQAVGSVHKICFWCWFWMPLCSWDAAGAQFREALLSLQQPPQLSLPLWNANNSERIFSLESLLYQHFNVYLCCVSLCPKTRRGSAPLPSQSLCLSSAFLWTGQTVALDSLLFQAVLCVKCWKVWRPKQRTIRQEQNFHNSQC